MNLVWSNDAADLYDGIYAEIEEEEGEEIIDTSVVWDRCYEEIERNLEDEQANLNIDKDHNIFLIGTMERWCGSVSAYKDLHVRNIGEALEKAVTSFDGNDIIRIEVEGDKLFIKQWGHDNPVSPSIFEFRAVKDYNSLEDLIWNKESDSKEMLVNESVSLGADVSKIYGWDIGEKK